MLSLKAVLHLSYLMDLKPTDEDPCCTEGAICNYVQGDRVMSLQQTVPPVLYSLIIFAACWLTPLIARIHAYSQPWQWYYHVYKCVVHVCVCACVCMHVFVWCTCALCYVV